MAELEAEAVPACLDDLHALLAEVWSQAPDVVEGDRSRLTIALAELVANVVEHGRTPSGRPPHLRVAVLAEAERLVADLRDDGIGFPPRADLPDDELAESGRGLALVHAVLDEVHYERRDEHNRWHLVVHRAG